MYKYALLIYGQIRCGLSGKYFETNLLELQKITKDSQVDVYILTERDENALQIAYEIEFLIRKYNYNLKLYVFTDQCVNLEREERLRQEKYNEKVIEDGSNLEDQLCGYNEFVAKLYYRKYYLHELFNGNRNENVLYDYVIWGRFFDMDYRVLRDFDFLKMNDDNIYCCSDNFVMGSEYTMNKFNRFAEDISKSFRGSNIVWVNEGYCKYFEEIDVCLYNCKPTYASEVQMSYYVYENFEKKKSLRFDYNRVPAKKGEDYLWAFIKRC